MTKSCPSCGAVAPAEARYCRHCGTALRATTGATGGETISPLANTEPLNPHGFTATELDAGPQHVSTTSPAGADARATSAQLPAADQTGDSGEITIPVVRPAAAADAAQPFAASAPAQVVPLSSSADVSPADVPAPERPTLSLWLAAGIGGVLLLCAAGAGVWYVLRERRAAAPPVQEVNAPPAPTDARQQAQAKLAEAQGLLAAGNPVGATARLREAVALDPQNAEAHRQLAQLLLESGARQTAIEELRAVTRLEPNDKDAWRQLAEAQFAEGAYADAADSYHTLMDVSNEALADDRLQLAYADALRLAGRMDGARALYRRLATSPLADVALVSKQRLAEVGGTLEADAAAPTRVEGTTDGKDTQPASPASHAAAQPVAVRTPTTAAAAAPADHYERGVQMWPANRAAALAEFRAAAANGNADAYYYLGLSLAEGRDPHALARAELVAALEYFQRARGGRFSAQARRYEDQLGQEFDRRRKQ